MKISKDFIFRIIKTFFQAIIAYVIVQFQQGVDFTSKEAVKTFVLGLIAAGLSAVFNIKKRKGGADNEVQ